MADRDRGRDGEVDPHDGEPADGVPPTQTRTQCSFCGVGCGIVATSAPDESGRRSVIKVAGDKRHPVNAGRLCTKGGSHAEVMAAPGRMTSAASRPRRGDELRPIATDEAIREAARRLRAIVEEHGRDAVGLYVSGQLTLEAQYLTTKLAKGFLRTVHLESNSRLCMTSASSGYKLS